MKRDDDYIRALLMECEASSDIYILATLHMNSSPEGLKRHHHAELLCDAGLFKSENKGVYRMTNQGHDYLAVIRNDTIWTKTKAGAAKVGGTTLGMLKDIAVAYVKQEATERLGISL